MLSGNGPRTRHYKAIGRDKEEEEEVVKEKRNILCTVKRRKVNLIGHILRRNRLLKHMIGGKIKEGIEVAGRQGRRRRQVLDMRKETKGYWKLKEEALDRTLWRTRFGRAYGTVLRQTSE